MLALFFYHPVVGVDIHWTMVPTPAGPVPTPLPHPFTGLVEDWLGMAIGAAISGAMSAALGGSVQGPVFINGMPAANTGTDGKNTPVMPHIPTPPGTGWAPVPAGIKPPIPGKPPDPGVPTPTPSNDTTMITGSKTVYISGTNACRLGDLSMSCGEPVRLPSSTSIAFPLGAPVLIGGPPALDFTAALMGMIRTQWVSGRLHALMKAEPGSWRSKIICFFTGHPVDVVSGFVMTGHVDYELPGPIPFKFERTYYSCSKYNGPLGHRWAHSYDQFLRLEKDRIVLHSGDGRELYFEAIAQGRRTENRPERLGLVNEGAFFYVDTSDCLRLCFQDIGRLNRTLPLTYIENSKGDRIDLRYNEYGNLISVSDSSGRTIGFRNDAQGRLVSLTVPHPQFEDQAAEVARFEYDLEANLVKSYDALGHFCQYKYKYHLLVQEINRCGFSFYFAYDGIDNDSRCVRTWGDGGVYDHMLTYSHANSLTLVDDSLGHTRSFNYNNAGLVTKIVDARGFANEFVYNDYGEIIKEIDPLGNTKTYGYDERGNIVNVLAADGASLQVVYNEYNKPAKLIDAVGGVWDWRYDKLGRLTKRTDSLGHLNRYKYESTILTSFIDPNGEVTEHRYDIQGNLVSTSTSEGSPRLWRYDYLGRIVNAEDSSGSSFSCRYDLLGNIVEAIMPDGNRIQYRYDPEGNILHRKDMHSEVEYTYTGTGRLSSRTEADSSVSLSYDKEARLIEITNENGDVYSFSLDENGEVVREQSFDGIWYSYRRDPAGRIIEKRTNSRQSVHYTYDAVDRITDVEYQDGTKEHYSYRRDGQLSKAVNNNITVKFERDKLGRIIKEWQGHYWVASEYDANGNRTRIRSTHGIVLDVQRNSIGDVIGVEFGLGLDQPRLKPTWKTEYIRDSMGSVIEQKYPGGISSCWKRDDLGRPLQHKVSRTIHSMLSTNYTWDMDYRLRRVVNADYRSTTYIHNALGELVSAAHSDGTIEPRFPDRIGNLFQTEECVDRLYGPAGQLIELYSTDETVRFEYDIEGNLSKVIKPSDLSSAYEWDAAGLLKRAVCADEKSVEFIYDALGRRISKSSKGRVTHWLWDGNNILHEWNNAINTTNNTNTQQRAEIAIDAVNGERNGAEQKNIDRLGHSGVQCCLSNNELVTWIFEPDTFVPIAKMLGDDKYAIITDHLGTPIAMFNILGEIVWQAELNVYGELNIVMGSKEDCPFRWPGQYEDIETNLYYNRFRYYDPRIGCYISQDPLQVWGGLNSYQYVHDPLNWFDPFGLARKGPPAWLQRLPRGTTAQAARETTLKAALEAAKRPGSTQNMVETLWEETLESVSKLSKEGDKAQRDLADKALKLLKMDKTEKAKSKDHC